MDKDLVGVIYPDRLATCVVTQIPGGTLLRAEGVYGVLVLRYLTFRR